MELADKMRKAAEPWGSPDMERQVLLKVGADALEDAMMAMSETHSSWESRCHAIMAALGIDYGRMDEFLPDSDVECASTDIDAYAADVEAVAKAIGQVTFDADAGGGFLSSVRLRPDICILMAHAALQAVSAKTKSSAPVDAPAERKLRDVFEGETPLDDDLDHPLLAVFRAGAKARDEGTPSPYSGHSLEHCLHAAGWVQRDLRLALNKAKDELARRNAESSFYA